MRIVILVLVALLLLLQIDLWRQVGQIGELERQVEAQREQNQVLLERNDALAAEVADLNSGLEAVEERARAELGLVRDGERFFLVVDPEDLPAGQAEAVRALEALPANVEKVLPEAADVLGLDSELSSNEQEGDAEAPPGDG